MGLAFQILFLMSLSVASKPETEFARLLADGKAFAKEFKNAEAVEALEKAISLEPMNYEARLLLLRVNNAWGQDLRDRKLEPEKVKYLFKRNVELAEALYHDFPNRVEAPCGLAIAYGNLALFSSPKDKVRLSRDIETLLKKAIEIDPQFAYSYLALAMFYREVSQITFWERFFAQLLWGRIPKATLEDAEKYFRLSLDRDPNFIFTRYNYARALELHEKFIQAIDEYAMVLKLPATESGDSFLKELSAQAISRLRDEYPTLESSRVDE